jgi:hypothetical protein
MTDPESQTARDAELELQDEGIPNLEDGSPQAAWAEDPEFMPVPGDDPGASTDFGTTAFEQSQGESLTARLDRELPDDAAAVRRSEDPEQAGLQLEQDTSTTFDTDSGTNKTADDIEATGDLPVGGEGPEEAAVHVVEG